MTRSTRPALAGLAVVLGLALPAHAADRAWLPGELVGTLPEAVTETSGITDGSRDDGVVFTHNDSSDLPLDPTNAQVFATTTAGELVATLQLDGIAVTDVEDIAWGPGIDGTTPSLYVADIGDNFRVRPQVVVYVLPEPALDPDTRDEVVRVTGTATYTLTYPGERHDAETLLVHPTTGELTIVTKTTSGVSLLFTAPRPTTTAAAAVLSPAGTLDLNEVWVRDSYNPDFPDNELQATGGEISPDGRHVVVRTYTEAHEWPLGEDGDVGAAVAAGPPVNVALPEEQQGEAIGYAAGGTALLTTSETTRTVHRMALATAPPPEPPTPPAGDGPALPTTGGGAALAALALLAAPGVARRCQRAPRSAIAP